MWIAALARLWPPACAICPLDARRRAPHLIAMTRRFAGMPFAEQLRGHLQALLMVAASTLAATAIDARWGASAVDLLFLPAVIGAAVLSGLAPALTAATASALAYNYFFTAPRFTFRIDDPNDLVTVVVLFAVAAVTSELAARVRRQAEIAQGHAERNATIAGLAGRLLPTTDEQAVADVAVQELGRIFDCNAVFITGPDMRLRSVAPASIDLTPGDIAAATLAFESGEPAGRGVARAVPTEWQFHPVRSSSATAAVLGLARDDGAPPVHGDQRSLFDSLVDQVALALERARLEAAARDFERTRERDRVRSALLSSIRRDLAPPLAEIGQAVAAMKREGSGDRAQLSLVAGGAARLDRYLDTLRDLDSPGDQQPVVIDAIAIDLVRRTVTRQGEAVHLTPKEYAVLAELAKHPGEVLTHAHLLRAVWGPAQEGQIDYLRVAVRALRQKLEPDPAAPRLIINEPAVGYRLSLA